MEKETFEFIDQIDKHKESIKKLTELVRNNFKNIKNHKFCSIDDIIVDGYLDYTYDEDDFDSIRGFNLPKDVKWKHDDTYTRNVIEIKDNIIITANTDYEGKKYKDTDVYIEEIKLVDVSNDLMFDIIDKLK